MIRRLALLAVLALAAAGCGGQRPSHGVLGERTTLSQTRVERQAARIDWALRRAQVKLARAEGPARKRVLALTQTTLRREAARLERTPVPARLESLRSHLVLALRALARDRTLASRDVATLRSSLASLR